jgi:UDP-GlcNAc:undecaprenyl-phosphate GlcNAc-1-phosphate transferase
VLFELFLAFLLAAAASFVSCRIVIAAGLTDAPDQLRKMHTKPTPTSGGIGAAIGFAASLALLTLMPVTSWSAALEPHHALRMGFAATAALLLFGIGLADDMIHLGPRLKMSVFIAASLTAAFVAGAPEAIVLGDGLRISLWMPLAIVGAALWVFVLMNAVNFMDGANGLAMGASMIALSGLALLSLRADAPHAAALALCGVGAIAGFLMWNFPTARLFVGDAGALFVGALAAVASLIAIADGGLSVFTPALLFFPMLADVLLTLAWRVGRRPRLMIGHRDHLYQIGLRAGWPHTRVSLYVWVATLACTILAVASAIIAEGTWLAPRWRSPQSEALSSYAPFAAFALAVFAALIVSSRIRKFAVERGLDGE